jgi:hypothetical protein
LESAWGTGFGKLGESLGLGSMQYDGCPSLESGWGLLGGLKDLVPGFWEVSGALELEVCGRCAVGCIHIPHSNAMRRNFG